MDRIESDLNCKNFHSFVEKQLSNLNYKFTKKLKINNINNINCKIVILEY